MKNVLRLLLIPLFLIMISFAYADGLSLTKIGALDVNGKYFTHWWYEPTNLTLEGTGSKGANIDVYIDNGVMTIKASVEDGKWKYTHEGQLEKKDHNVKISSGEQNISFILTIGAGSVPVDETTKGELPQTGALLPILGIVALAGFLIYYGFRERVV
ncbi:hypothetical protein HZC27_00745 [Candidatus Roizmanbacteria bacterium]|nr:hypothetical protein [Candidatus Roizmanbacteria bacterium]